MDTELPKIPQLPKHYQYSDNEKQRFNDNIKLVGYMITVSQKLIRVLSSKGYTKDEIYQIGCYGLLSACRDINYSESLGEFSTYACKCIYNAYRLELKNLSYNNKITVETNFDILENFLNNKFFPRLNGEMISVDELIKAIDELPIELKEALVQYYYSETNITMREVGEQNNICAEAVRQRILRAIKLLREKLNV
jgi:RNA polymerase sigma factor (sigma-70 family)